MVSYISFNMLSDSIDTIPLLVSTKRCKAAIVTGLSISYVAAQENLEKFNKTRLRDNYPDIYDECIDMNGKRAAYITIRK